MAVTKKKTSAKYDDLQVEDRVKHPKFGEGTILQRVGSGQDAKFVVAFVEEGERRLMARYAKLKKILPIQPAEE